MDNFQNEQGPESALASSPLESLTEAQVSQLAQLQSVLVQVMEALVLPLETEIGEMPVLQVRCLRVISRRPGQNLGDVAKQMNVSLPGASRTVEKLVRSGLVERRSDPRDRRALQLETTEQSQALLTRMQSARQAHLAACTRGFRPEEMAQVLNGLRLLADMAEKSYQESKAACQPAVPEQV